MTTIVLTPEDVTKAQATQDVVLTDSGDPLELLCTAYDVRTYNEREENNWDYINEQKEYIINNLSYETKFLAKLDKESRLFYADNLKMYDEYLATYTEEQKELIQNWEGDLYEEYAKVEQQLYDWLWKERLNGDRRDVWGLGLLKDKMSKDNNHYDVELAYDENTQILTITIDDIDADEEDKRTHDIYLVYLVRRVVSIKADRRVKAEQRKQEREEQAARAAEHKEREQQKKRERILQG